MYRIIIADDEEYVRELLAKNINQSQTEFQVVGKAVNGKQALDQIKELKPDILITDICMPIMDGLELIHSMQEMSLPVKTVIISGYDDFSYARQAVKLGVTEYLLKPFSPDEVYAVLDKIKEELERQQTLMNNITDMKNQLAGNLQMFQEQVLKQLLEKKEPSARMLEQVQKAQIDLNAAYYAVGIFGIYQNLKYQECDMKDFFVMIKDTYFPDKCKTYLTGFYEKQIVILFAGNYRNVKAFIHVVRDGLNAIGESMEKYYDMKTSCVIGGIYEEWNKIPDSYKDARSVWRGILENPKELIFYEDELRAKSAEDREPFESPRELEDKLLVYIQMGQEGKAEECLYEILRYYESMDVQSSNFVSIALVEMVFEISHTMRKADVLGQVWEDENVMEYLKEHLAYGSLKDAQAVLCDYVVKCCRQFASINKTQGERIVFQIKELIEKNLGNEEFGLEMASAQLFFSPNYVRQIFKQIAGESFMEYLIRRRMETARELLKNTSYKILDVAVETGYSNQRYFASCFKKYYGCTPTEYRNQLKNQQ